MTLVCQEFSLDAITLLYLKPIMHDDDKYKTQNANLVEVIT